MWKVGVGREGEGGEIVARTANSTYINQRATVTVLHRCQESHPLSSSPSSSQQQNCRLSHQPSEQYPILMSDSHSVTIEMIAALIPMLAPAHGEWRRNFVRSGE